MSTILKCKHSKPLGQATYINYAIYDTNNVEADKRRKLDKIDVDKSADRICREIGVKI